MVAAIGAVLLQNSLLLTPSNSTHFMVSFLFHFNENDMWMDFDFGGFSLWNLDEVRMWVFEETLPSGEKLTEVINRTNVSIPPNMSFILYANLCS